MLVYNGSLQQTFSTCSYFYLLHHSQQLIGRLESLDLVSQSVHLPHLFFVELSALLPYLGQFLKVSKEVVVNNTTDLFILCSIVHEFLSILFDSFLEFLQIWGGLSLRGFYLSFWCKVGVA